MVQRIWRDQGSEQFDIGRQSLTQHSLFLHMEALYSWLTNHQPGLCLSGGSSRQTRNAHGLPIQKCLLPITSTLRTQSTLDPTLTWSQTSRDQKYWMQLHGSRMFGYPATPRRPHNPQPTSRNMGTPFSILGATSGFYVVSDLGNINRPGVATHARILTGPPPWSLVCHVTGPRTSTSISRDAST